MELMFQINTLPVVLKKTLDGNSGYGETTQEAITVIQMREDSDWIHLGAVGLMRSGQSLDTV